MRTVPMSPSVLPFDWDEVGAPVVQLDATGRLLAGNRAFLTLWSAVPADPAGSTAWLAAWQPASRERLLQLLQQRSRCIDDLVWGVSEPPRWFDACLQWHADGAMAWCALHETSRLRRALQAADARTQQLLALADALPLQVALYDLADGHCVYANRLAAQAQQQGGVLTPADAPLREQLDRLALEPAPRPLRHAHTQADGERRWLDYTVVPQGEAADGAPRRAFVLVGDVTAAHQADLARRESEERLGKFMRATMEGILFHVDSVITDVNPALCQLMGYSLEEMLGRNALDLIAPDHRDRAAAVGAARLETTLDSMMVHRDGTRIPVELITRTMVRDGQTTRMVIVRDVRDRVAAQARINFLAHHDPLTGLPNRSAFMDHLDQLMLSARATQAELALLFIDLDHFKRVNDSLGHLVGDALLRTVARRILDCVRGTDRVARFGGDEFMVLLPGLRESADIEQVAAKLIAAIEVPMEAEGRPLSVTPSVGIAVFPRDGTTPDELIKHADTAMYVAKSRGRANYQFFEPANAVSAYADMVLEGQLAHAIERAEFTLYFQPQVHAQTGHLVGAEALIRWQHPDHGLLAPDEFIGLAEQRRLMLPIGQWVLREAARCARSWRDTVLRDVTVAVNLSTIQFRALDFIDSLAQVLREEEVPGAWLELELTERMLMDDLGAVRRTLAQLKAMGLRLSVDDFGTGYSSLGHLKDLPIDKMKIDRSFVKDLPAARDSAAITSAIIQMARNLDLTVVAEGVENAAQAAFLSGHGCHALQGAAISPPLSRAQFEAWARERAQRDPPGLPFGQ